MFVSAIRPRPMTKVDAGESDNGASNKISVSESVLSLAKALDDVVPPKHRYFLEYLLFGYGLW